MSQLHEHMICLKFIFILLQYFPPRCDWIIHPRHQRTELKPVQRLMKVIISNRIQGHVENSLGKNEESESVIHDSYNKSMINSQIKSKSNEYLDSSNGKNKQRKRTKNSAVKNKSTCSKIPEAYTSEQTTLEAGVYCTISENSRLEEKPTKGKRNKRRPKNIIKSTGKDTATQISYGLYSIKTNTSSKTVVETVPSKNFQKFSLPELPRLPIPDTWKWQHKPRQVDKVPQLPLPTSWKWYSNPLQFKKRPHPSRSSECLSSDRQDSSLVKSATSMQEPLISARSTRQSSIVF